MKNEIYNFLVSKHAGISHRYHKVHDGATGIQKIASWAYLLWMNFAFYLLFCKFLGKVPDMEIYEKKRLPVKESESESYCRQCLSVDAFVEKIKDYDVISFDIFDTLIFLTLHSGIPFCPNTYILKIQHSKFLTHQVKNILRKIQDWTQRLVCGSNARRKKSFAMQIHTCLKCGINYRHWGNV